MKILYVITLSILGLSFVILKSEVSAKQTTILDQEACALIQFCEKVIKTSNDFEYKYGNKPRLLCSSCKKEYMTHGDLLGAICLDACNVFAEPNKIKIAKKLINEAFEIFPQKSLDELTNFMLRAANESQISCHKCSGKSWEIIKYPEAPTKSK